MDKFYICTNEPCSTLILRGYGVCPFRMSFSVLIGLGFSSALTPTVNKLASSKRKKIDFLMVLNY